MTPLAALVFGIVLIVCVVAIGVLACVVHEQQHALHAIRAQLSATPGTPTCSCARGATIQVSTALRKVADEIDRGGYSS